MALQLKFGFALIYYSCTEIKDRNGNYITITYNNFGSGQEINTITDTLGRVITFNYDTYGQLNSITQTWGGQTHTWATFAYGNQTIQTNFSGLTPSGASNGSNVSVLKRVGLADGSVYSFEYNTYCQVKTIRRYAPNVPNPNPDTFPNDYFQRAYTTYDLPDAGGPSQTDCPRFTTRTDWAYEWNEGVTRTFAPTIPNWASGEVTMPDGTVYKETFATSGWQRGLTTQAETKFGGVMKKWTTFGWTQDNTGVSYRLNPRVTETNVYDDASNRRRTTIGYTSFGLPLDVIEYDALPNINRVLRRTHADYNLSQVYTDRRIIGLPNAQYVYDGNGYVYTGGTYNNPNEILASKVLYFYDESGLVGTDMLLQSPPAAAVRHDVGNYGNWQDGSCSTCIHERGNLTTVRRYNVDPTQSTYVESKTGYHTTGSPYFMSDPLAHKTRISYQDSFSDLVNHNTFAYPTTLTDADNYSSTIQYDYSHGAVTRTQNPKGAAVTRTYDAAGRIDRITNVVNNAYTRYVYALNQYYAQSFTTINDLGTEFYSITLFDGHDRVRATASDHPNSVGLNKAQYNVYDVMGRLASQSNPTEINGDWSPVGDDAYIPGPPPSGGWVWSSQAYDWKGRPTVTTNQRGNTSIIDYSGCACAGGEVTTIQDEGQVNYVGNPPVPTLQRRKTQIIHDALGREKKQVAYDWDGTTVYVSTTTAYNARDQVTSVKQYKGDGDGVSCPTATCQEGTRSYDGHGRLSARRLPQDDGDTTYTYYDNDLLQTAIDARGATGNFAYNGRGLMISANYTGGSGVPPSVSFDYDELGNPLWMDDGPGKVKYVYNTLGRLTEEKRFFDSLDNPDQSTPPDPEEGGRRPFILKYEYNLAGGLKQVTDPRGDVIYYGYDSSGRLNSVTGSSFAGVTNYATGFQYRAWDQPKYLDYGDSFHADIGYNPQMKVNSFNIPGVLGANYTLNEDSRIRSAQSLIDSRLNRSFDWDHLGRITSSVGGGDPIQFNQAYGYDEYSHMTSRSGQYWNTFSDSMSATYSRERAVSTTEHDTGPAPPTFNRSFQFDAMGNTTQVTTTVVPWSGGSTTSTEPNVFDAVGRPRTSGELDGYGREVIKYLEYKLISTPIGQQVLTTLDSNGQKKNGRVYVGTDLLAEQIMLSGQPSEVLWRHRDPMNTAARDTKSGGWTDQLYMVDSLGAMLKPATATEIQQENFNMVCLRAPHPGCPGQPPVTSFYTPTTDVASSNGGPGKWASGCNAFTSAAVSCGNQLDFFNHMSEEMQRGYLTYVQRMIKSMNPNMVSSMLNSNGEIAYGSFAGVAVAGIGGTHPFKLNEKWSWDYQQDKYIRRWVVEGDFLPGGAPQQLPIITNVSQETPIDDDIQRARQFALVLARIALRKTECRDEIAGSSGKDPLALLNTLASKGQFNERYDPEFEPRRDPGGTTSITPAFTRGRGEEAIVLMNPGTGGFKSYYRDEYVLGVRR